MKALLVALTVFIAVNVSAQDGVMVRVVATGATPAKALDEARRKAIEQVSGIVVTSELESNKKRLVKDEIGNYSAGYVAKENIVKQTQTADFWIVEAEVWVRPSSMANQRLNTGKDQKSFDGQTIGTQIKTYGDSIASAESLLMRIANDYPKRAFVIQSDSQQIGINQNGNPVISIDYVIAWSRDYLTALRETLSTVGAKDRTDNKVVVHYKKPDSLLITEETFYIQDNLMAFKFKEKMSYSVYLRAEFKDEDNNLVGAMCYSWDPGKVQWVDGRNIYGNKRYRATINFEIEKTSLLYKNIDKVTKIELTTWQRNMLLKGPEQKECDLGI